MCKDVSYEMSEATQINLDMQGRDWRIKHGYEDPDNEYCVRCEQYIPHFEQAIVEGAASPLYCEQCNEDGLYSVSFETWERRIGKPVKFVDEEAVIEAYAEGTEYPRLYHGTLRAVLYIRIIGRHTLYAKIEPRWTETPKFVPVSQVRLVK